MLHNVSTRSVLYKYIQNGKMFITHHEYACIYPNILCPQDANLQVRNFEELVASLNNQGFLLKKGPRVYQLQTADY